MKGLNQKHSWFNIAVQQMLEPHESWYAEVFEMLKVEIVAIATGWTAKEIVQQFVMVPTSE